MNFIEGFSKFNKTQKINWLLDNMKVDQGTTLIETKYIDDALQKRFENFSENTIANFHLPFGIAPNFLINDKVYSIPMVTEESSVVAASCKAAKFWNEHGGFKAYTKSMTKVGHVYFTFDLSSEIIEKVFKDNIERLLNCTRAISLNMDKRGGGIKSLELLPLDKLSNTYKLELRVNTCDAMGANFINSLLEAMSAEFRKIVIENHFENHFEIIFAILSNYTPECLVEASVALNLNQINEIDGMSAQHFFSKFKKAVDIAKFDKFRATTHNKGIMNGVDSVVIATGNDFRATEAAAHSFACKDGIYKSLSEAEIVDHFFTFKLSLPLALGTVGGLTNLHPLASLSLDMLGKPSASELMQIAASVGLAQNFSAIRSLITTGIQKGHMKMHLLNILDQLGASVSQIEDAKKHFSDKVVSFQAVRDFLN